MHLYFPRKTTSAVCACSGYKHVAARDKQVEGKRPLFLQVASRLGIDITLLLVRQHVASGVFVHLVPSLIYEKLSVCQNRLGTNVKNSQNKTTVFMQVAFAFKHEIASNTPDIAYLTTLDRFGKERNRLASF